MKSIFHLFQRAFRCQKLSQILECIFKSLLNHETTSYTDVRLTIFQSYCISMFTIYQQSSYQNKHHSMTSLPQFRTLLIIIKKTSKWWQLTSFTAHYSNYIDKTILLINCLPCLEPKKCFIYETKQISIFKDTKVTVRHLWWRLSAKIVSEF